MNLSSMEVRGMIKQWFNSAFVSSESRVMLLLFGGFPLDSLAKGGFPSLHMQYSLAKSFFPHTNLVPSSNGQDCPKSCFSEICTFQFFLQQICPKFWICLDGHLQVLGLTQPTVLTLEWIRGLLLLSPSASVVNLLLTIPQSIPSGTSSLKWQITCKTTVFTV